MKIFFTQSEDTSDLERLARSLSKKLPVKKAEKKVAFVTVDPDEEAKKGDKSKAEAVVWVRGMTGKPNTVKKRLLAAGVKGLSQVGHAPRRTDGRGPRKLVFDSEEQATEALTAIKSIYTEEQMYVSRRKPKQQQQQQWRQQQQQQWQVVRNRRSGRQGSWKGQMASARVKKRHQRMKRSNGWKQDPVRRGQRFQKRVDRHRQQNGQPNDGVCDFYRKGQHCPYADMQGGCMFAHPVQVNQAHQHSHEQDGVCNYFREGSYCPYWDTPDGCRFDHPSQMDHQNANQRSWSQVFSRGGRRGGPRHGGRRRRR